MHEFTNLDQPKESLFVQTRLELVVICDNDPFAATLLREIDFLCSYHQSHTLKFSSRMLEDWVYGLVSHKQVQRLLRKLETLGFLEWSTETSLVTYFPDKINAAIGVIDWNHVSRNWNHVSSKWNHVSKKLVPDYILCKEVKEEKKSPPTPQRGDSPIPLIDFLQDCAKTHGRHKPGFDQAKERRHLAEVDSPEMRERWAAKIATSDSLDVKQVILDVAGYSGRAPAKPRNGFARQERPQFQPRPAAPRYEPRQPPPRRQTMPERILSDPDFMARFQDS